jgi:hypothetical protein
MDQKTIINICGLIGALLLIVFHFIVFQFGFPKYQYTSYFVNGISDLCILLSPVSGILGYVVGKTGAKSQTVKFAFGQGGMIAFLASVCLIIPIFIFGIESGIIKLYSHYMIYLSLSLICYGSLLSGMFAIISRDYRQFQRLRIIPQFTLGEILTVIFLVAVIMGSFTSINMISQSPS